MKAGDQYHGSPVCRCGSRATRRVGYLMRECQSCGQIYSYRLYDGILVPMDKLTAQLLDEERAYAHRG